MTFKIVFKYLAKQLHHWLVIVVLFCSPCILLAEMRVFGLQDFNLGRWVLGAGPIQANANICVTINPPAPYQVTAYGSTASNAFTLTNGNDFLPYRMFFNDRPSPNGATELQAGQALGGQRGRAHGQNQQQCNRPTANISLYISDTDLARSSSGQYSGTVIIIVGPE